MTINVEVIQLDIGKKIREIRNRREITIAQMSSVTGLSKGFISNVENNNTSPSINTLSTIADFLNVPLPYLLLEEKRHMRVIRKNERQTTSYKDVKIEHLTSKRGLRVMIVESPPGVAIGEDAPHAHEGEEFHLVLKGRVFAQQGEDSVVAEEGDTFSWSASVPHYVKNIGEEPSVILIAVYSESNSEEKI